MLDVPLMAITQADGKTTIKPSRWALKDAATLVRVVLKINEASARRAKAEEDACIDEEFIIENY